MVSINSKYGSGKLQKIAKEAFEKMAKAAKQDNVSLISGSAYRSYSHQKDLYNYYNARFFYIQIKSVIPPKKFFDNF